MLEGVAIPPPPHHPAHGLADTRLGRLGFLSAGERAALARVEVASRTLAAGEELIHQGSFPDDLYLLSAGWAFRYITTRGGGRQVPALLVPGDVCNLDSLLLARADFGVRTLTRATVLVLPRARALALAAEHPGIGRAFTWFALGENAILSQWAVGLGRRQAQGRLAHFLCETSHRLGGADSFELPLTQEVIADALGLTPVHVNRTLRQLKAKGLIATAGRTMRVLDGAGLRALAEFDGSYLRQIEDSAAAPPVAAG